MRIKLWQELNKRMGKEKLSLNDFKIQLAEITNDRDRAIDRAETIRNIYIDAMSFYDNEIVKKVTKNSSLQGSAFIEKRKNNGVDEEVPENMILIQSGSSRVMLPKNNSSIEVMKTILEQMKIDISSNLQKKEKTED